MNMKSKVQLPGESDGESPLIPPDNGSSNAAYFALPDFVRWNKAMNWPAAKLLILRSGSTNESAVKLRTGSLSHSLRGGVTPK
jgi:hypothetical protein